MVFHKPAAAICSALAFHNLTAVTRAYFILLDGATIPGGPLKTLKYESKKIKVELTALQLAEMGLISTLLVMHDSQTIQEAANAII